MTISINIAAIHDWETGAPEVNPNTDTAFDASEALPSGPCRTCGDAPVAYDMTICDECCAPLCVHCAQTRDSEDVVCPACHQRYMAEAAAPLVALPSPWRMSIAELDSWLAYYRTRLRGLGLGAGALTAIETAHRAEVEANINARHEARRHSHFSH